MNYENFIRDILNTRGRFNVEGYKERHHILPRCMGGTDDESNMIDLTAAEHFVAHALLFRENNDNTSLMYAFNMMANKINNSLADKIIDKDELIEEYSKEYELARQMFAIKQSEFMHIRNSNFRLTDDAKRKIGETRKARGIKPWNTGKHWDDETKQKISNAKLGVPNTKLQGRKFTQEHCDNLSKSHKGSIPWNKGISMSDEQRQHLSDVKKALFSDGTLRPAMEGKHHSDESKALISKHKKGQGLGKRWFTNGTTDTLAYDCPDGFTSGRSSIRCKNKSKGHAGGSNSHAIKVQCVETGEVFDCIKVAANKYDIKTYHISRCCKGEIEAAGGYHWIYFKDKIKEEINE